MSMQPVSRPAGVTVVIVLMWIAAILEILGGIGIIAASGDLRIQLDSGYSQSFLFWVGIVTMVFGVVTILLAIALAGGSNGARIITTILVVLQMASDLWEFVAVAHGTRLGSLIGFLIWLIILILLWTGRANDFFNQRRTV